MPEVSVIFPVYNERAENLRLSVESLLGQTFSDLEIVVIDDSTNEETRTLLDRFAEQNANIRVLRPSKRQGLAAALNLGIAHANGRYLARADSDDVQEPNRVLHQVQFLNANPQVGVVGSAITKIDRDGNDRGCRPYPASHAHIHRTSCIRNPVCHPTVMVRKELLERYGAYDPSFKAAEDYELWLRLIRHGVRFANLEEPLVRYRLADTIRRDRNAYNFNLMAKRRHFSFDHLLIRVFGLTLVCGYHYIVPSFLKEPIYQLYNRT